MRANVLSKNLYLYLFLLLYVVLLPKKWVVGVTIIGLIISISLLIKYWRTLLPEIKNNRYLYANLAFLIPIGIAMIDTLYPDKRYSVFLTVLIYLFIGVLPIYILATNGTFKRLESLVAISLVLISIDAILQWQFGYHILGYNPLIDSRVRGIFGEWYHLSYFLGTLAPILFFVLYEKLEQKVTWLRIVGIIIAIMLITTGVILGGARAGFISFGVSIILFILYLFFTNKIKYKLRFSLAVLFILVITIIALSQSSIVQDRFFQTTVPRGNEDFLYRFTTLRTNIWYVAIREVPNYWLNGVGVRGFDTLYQTYPDDYKIFVKIWHPHLHGLEVLIETGLIGFIPYMILCIYLLIKMFKAKAGNAWLMMAFVAIMPINSHTGLYYDYWLAIVFVPMMIGLALAYRAEKRIQTNSNP